jgi:hypothetical protein
MLNPYKQDFSIQSFQHEKRQKLPIIFLNRANI